MWSKFQIILTIVFGAFLIIGLIVFSVYKGGQGDSANISIWGTLAQSDFQNIVSGTSIAQNKNLTINYIEKSKDSFDNDLVEAIASGNGPDIFLLPQDKIIKQKNKAYIIPYSVYSQRSFKDTFVEGAEIFMLPDGILGLPIYIDPMVMYWNRSMFNEAGVTQAPKYWDEFYSLATNISKKDGALNITKSAVALGEYANINYAKQIISTLAMQAGTPIVIYDGQKFRSVLLETWGKASLPSEAAINFYTEFSNPAKSSYSWNRALGMSQNMFLSGDLAMYFAPASELWTLKLKNPNLNFDVAPMPQSRSGGNSVVFGDFLAGAVSKSSKNPNAAFNVLSILSGADGAKAIKSVLRLPSARRDALQERQPDAFMGVFYDGAIKAKAWLDPDPVKTSLIFKEMVESVTSGRARTSEAITRASRAIDDLFGR